MRVDALSVLLVIPVFTDVLVAVGKSIGTLSVVFIILPFTNVLIAFGVGVGAKTVVEPLILVFQDRAANSTPLLKIETGEQNLIGLEAVVSSRDFGRECGEWRVFEGGSVGSYSAFSHVKHELTGEALCFLKLCGSHFFRN